MLKVCKRCEQEKDEKEFRECRGICKRCENEKYKEYYYANTKKQYLKIKQWRHDNPERTRETLRRNSHKRYYADIEKARKIGREKQAVYQRKQRKTLADSYIKQRILREFGIKKEDIPTEMIEAKRDTIKAKRLYKQIKEKLT